MMSLRSLLVAATLSSPTWAGPVPNGNSIPPPSPIQEGMVANCNNFYLVKASDGFCGDIATKNGISLANFYAWNPAVGPGCGALWLDTYYWCV